MTRDRASALSLFAAALAILLAVAWPDLRAWRAGQPPVTFAGERDRE